MLFIVPYRLSHGQIISLLWYQTLVLNQEVVHLVGYLIKWTYRNQKTNQWLLSITIFDNIFNVFFFFLFCFCFLACLLACLFVCLFVSVLVLFLLCFCLLFVYLFVFCLLVFFGEDPGQSWRKSPESHTNTNQAQVYRIQHIQSHKALGRCK